MNTILKTALAVAGLGMATQAAAQITFYEHDGFKGRTFATQKEVANFQRIGFNDAASSVVVTSGRWEVCENARYEGRCVVLRPGQYPSLRNMDLSDRISSVRQVGGNTRVEDARYAPAPLVENDYRRRGKERLYQADVTSVRAVVGQQPEQRCWVEREQVSQGRGDANIPGAVIGAVLGGVLGHQVGSGRGNDAATAGGAVVGGLVGSNVGRDGGQSGYGRDVRRCENVQGSATPAYWDVTYNFHGRDHRVQMSAAPGRTVTVNEQGEPRT